MTPTVFTCDSSEPEVGEEFEVLLDVHLRIGCILS